jgi:uncharacterized protein (TIGR03437 family)
MPFRLLHLCLLTAAASAAPALVYSTYLRDGFTPQAIAADQSGNIYLAGNAIVDSPTSQNAILIVKLDAQASKYLYLRYLGGSVNDTVTSVAVDRTGNAYIAGFTVSPDFPVTNDGSLAVPPAGVNDQRSFVIKLDPNGELVFSELVGGSASSAAMAIAVNAAGQVIVTGTSASSGFPTTPGAYSIANSANHPYLLELDPTGTKVVFSATGIGGSALALDSSGNIFVAGTTTLLDYPTTPGAYQTIFPVFRTCYFPCQLSLQGPNQYVTKVDPAGSKLIFSTAVAGGGDENNQGLAVDASGNVYLTGFAGVLYPFTVPTPKPPSSGTPAGTTYALPFLSKLDADGKNLLFSIPVGGAGVEVDSSGFIYAGGNTASPGSHYTIGNIPALAGVPAQCLPNALIGRTAYASQVDAASGAVLSTQFLGGSTLGLASIALAGSTMWMTGSTRTLDFALTPNAFTPSGLRDPQLGAYLGAVDFSKPEPPASSPRIACILDGADFASAGPIAAYQLLSIFGTDLGPQTGVAAPDFSTTTLAGVSVNFGSVAAPLLYVSSSQINLAVPAPAIGFSASSIKLTKGVSTEPLQLPLTVRHPSIFLNFGATLQSDPTQFFALALNQDGSMNSVTNPARLGSSISVFANSLSPVPSVVSTPLQLSSTWGWSVTNASPETPFVTRVTLQVPATLQNNFSCSTSQDICTAGFTIVDVDAFSVGPQPVNVKGESFGGVVYVSRTP